jgi:hypothetical protein
MGVSLRVEKVWGRFFSNFSISVYLADALLSNPRRFRALPRALLSYSDAQLLVIIAPQIPQLSAHVGRTVLALFALLFCSLPSRSCLCRACPRPLFAARLFIEQHVTRRASTHLCGGSTVKYGSPTWRCATGGARACQGSETSVARGGRARQRRCVTSRSCARCSRGGSLLR